MDQSELLGWKTGIQFAPDSGSNPLTININENITYQTIDGFGATFSEVGWL